MSGGVQAPDTVRIDRDLTIGEPSVSGAFALAGDHCPDTLAPEASCEIEIVHAPTSLADGPQTGDVAVTGRGGGRQVSVIVGLSGFAATTGLTVDPVTVDFGDVIVGDTGPLRTVEMTNTGNVPVQVSLSLPSPSPFAFTDAACGTELDPGETCVQQFSFRPDSGGDHADTVTVGGEIELASGPFVFEPDPVSLSGTGIPVTGDLDAPTTVDFGDVPVGETVSRQVTVTNGMNVPVVVSSIDVGAAAPVPPTADALARVSVATARPLATAAVDGPFGVDAGDCTGTLAPGATCTMTVTFAPPSVGDATTTLRVVTDRADLAMALAGVGVQVDDPDDPDGPGGGDGPGGRLPITGSTVATPTLLGLALVALGAVAVGVTRRRRPH